MKTFTIKQQTVMVRADSQSTGGVAACLEMHHPPESGAPLHRHAHEDEGFYVLAGRYRFRVGDVTREVQAGDFVMAARTVVHGFRSLGPDVGRLLVYFTPGGIEAYFEARAAIADDDPERGAKSAALDQQFGIEIVPRGTRG